MSPVYCRNEIFSALFRAIGYLLRGLGPGLLQAAAYFFMDIPVECGNGADATP